MFVAASGNDLHKAAQGTDGFDLTQKNLYAALLVGGQVHLSPCQQFDPEQILHEIQEDRITLLNCTPSMFYSLVDDPSPERLARLDSLRTVFLGGEPIDMSRLSAWRMRKGFAAEVVNTYGPTECTDICSFYRVGPQSREMEIPIGHPIYNVRTYVLDENLVPLPVGVKGELCIGGAGVGAGYINDGVMNELKFPSDPFAVESEARLYRTGDLCRYRKGGAIEFIGRADDQIKIRGFRVELGEIEATLREHPNVNEVVVVADEQRSNNTRLIAYLVLVEKDDNVARELGGFLRDRLPDHMSPRVFMPLDELPLTVHGKVDRRALPAPTVRGNEKEAETRYVVPRDEMETRLAAIWCEVLEVERVGVLDSFFNLGGDSLMTVRLASIIRRQFDRELPIAVLLQGDTVADIARYLRQRVPVEWSPLVPIQPHGDRLPLFCIHPIGGNVLCYSELAGSLGDDQPVYGIQARGVDGSLEPTSSMDEMVEEYVAAIREVTSGPYHLAGWSSGGVVAYEIARRLKAAGAEVGSLTLFDSLAPALLDVDADDEAMILTELAGFLNRFYQLGIDLNYDELSSLHSRERTALVLERARRTNFLPADLDEDYVQRFLHVCQANLRAIDAYEAEPGDLQLTLYRAGHSEPRGKDGGDIDADLGWRDLVGDGLRIEHVEGDHVSMLTGDRARRLGRLVRRNLKLSEESLTE